LTSSRLETLLLTYCQLEPSLGRTHTHEAGVMDAKRLLGGERQEHVLSHAAAVAMDAKWLLGRADESVVAIGCCVKGAGLIMQISRVGGV